jgi:putative transposase
MHRHQSIQTALALRQAIWRKGDPHWSVCGIPEAFYNDHGSDFTSHHLEHRLVGFGCLALSLSLG